MDSDAFAFQFGIVITPRFLKCIIFAVIAYYGTVATDWILKTEETMHNYSQPYAAAVPSTY